MRLAIVTDWLTTFGGAERVVADMHALYPDAPIFTTVARPAHLGPLRTADIRTTSLQTLYRATGQYQPLLPLMPRAVEDMDLRGFDVILSSSHAVAKGIIPPATAVHVCYCHTPVRYAWDMEDVYLRDFRIPRLLQPFVRHQLRTVRRWDLTTAKRVDVFLANSTTTQERIQRTYARESIVVPPPIDDRFFQETGTGPDDADPFFLAIGRLVPYKRFDLLITAANAMRFPLHIAGTGQDEPRLRRMAGPTVRFLGRVDDAALPSLYARARAVLSPQEEDAGIVPREAIACGTPCIAYGVGGVLDVVQHGTTGLLFPEQTADSLLEALRAFDALSWDRAALRATADRFHRKHFQAVIRDAVDHARGALQPA